MPDAIGGLIESGTLQLCCIASVDDASWYDDTIPLPERAQWQLGYDACLEHEVLPLVASINPDPVLITAGASFGGYHAITFALRHPQLVTRVVSLSGLPDIRRVTHGESGGPVYFCNPAEFMANEHDPERMAAFRRMDIILAVGRDDSLCAANEAFSALLWQKGIGNALRVWDGWAHDWPWWQQMLQLYIGGHD